MEAFYELVAQVQKPSNEAIAALEGICTVTSIKKSHQLVLPGASYNKEIIVLNGLLRGYYVNEAAEEFNNAFFLGPSAVSPCFTRLYDRRSTIGISALTDATIVTMDYLELEKLRYQYDALRKWGQQVMINDLLMRSQRDFMLTACPAQTRYEWFQQQFREALPYLPQYHIASYLGITAVSLSRIRANMSH